MKDHSSPAAGHFHLRVFRRGLLVPELCLDEPNLVVDVAKLSLAHLLGGDVTQRSVTQIGFGSNIAAPASTNTALATPFVKTLDSVAYPSSSQVAFNFSLASSEANGLQIAEFGLLCANGNLFARKVRNSALPKDTDISFTGTWTISF